MGNLSAGNSSFRFGFGVALMAKAEFRKQQEETFKKSKKAIKLKKRK
jgi:hypothetical protein